MADDNVARLKALREDYKKVFESEEGKRVMADMERTAFFKGTTFVPKDHDATIFNEGLRAFLIHIKTILELDVETLERIRKDAV